MNWDQVEGNWKQFKGKVQQTTGQAQQRSSRRDFGQSQSALRKDPRRTGSARKKRRNRSRSSSIGYGD
jgi:uncharacterized protein YjbJ (UPF0337 family)